MIRVLDETGPGVTVGPSILSLLTSGIYDDPLAIYREYIQNAVDELSRMEGVDGKVEIAIDVRQKRVSICDNGPGLTYEECLEDLVPIAQSKKCVGRDRGFRGIGRLSGLAFAESVTFLTRASGRDPVTRVAWSRNGLANQANPTQAAGKGFQGWVSVDSLEDLDYPEHFFRVEIEGVSRHAAGALLNREAVRGYISEVCPVPLPPDFPFFDEIQKIFPSRQLPYSLRVTLDGEEQPIQRQYGPAIALVGNKEDQIQDFEELRVPSVDRSGAAAVGWIAHSSYLGAILKANRIRGIRARLGNIQVGDEKVFDHLFEEQRFNRWCVGELHILDSRITPNGRRDYFERDPHLRNLENYLVPVLRTITAKCRSASSNRNREKRLIPVIADVEAMFELASSGCLAANDATVLVQQALQRVAKTYQDMETQGVGKEFASRLSEVEMKLRSFHPKGRCFPLPGMSRSEVDTYRKVFGAIAGAAPSPRSGMEIIKAVITNSSKGVSDL